MTGFTTRPEIRGTFGAVASTHWIASAVGMGILERGGNAFDAALTGLPTALTTAPLCCSISIQLAQVHPCASAAARLQARATLGSKGGWKKGSCFRHRELNPGFLGEGQVF